MNKKQYERELQEIRHEEQQSKQACLMIVAVFVVVVVAILVGFAINSYNDARQHTQCVIDNVSTCDE